MTKPIEKLEFGDFQTPIDLAKRIVRLLREKHKIRPDIIIEPTCGIGAFVIASCNEFKKSAIFGFDINRNYIQESINKVANCANEVNLYEQDFFSFNWNKFLEQFDKNNYFLILGNPPWVTSSDLGAINSKNLPQKKNIENKKGIHALTGSSNFDISEWMLLQYVEWLRSRKGTIAQLCKYSVARKILKRIEKNKNNDYSAYIYSIDAKKEFGASVEACLFVLESNTEKKEFCVYSSIDSASPLYTISKRNGIIIKDVKKYDLHQELDLIHPQSDQKYIWRSGLKHDCSKIMELEKTKDGKYINGSGDILEIEDTYIYPLMKSSAIANKRINTIRKYVIVTQKKIGENTDIISNIAPKTWQYLLKNSYYLDKRKSSIYKNKPRFSIFGVGEYTFKPWKIAISGLYKKLDFVLIGPLENKAVIFDDTVNFLSFDTKDEAEFIYKIITSNMVLEFLDSMIFWDNKRPITTKILNRLNLEIAAKKLNLLQEYNKYQNTINNTLF